jgi:hypothetical protein
MTMTRQNKKDAMMKVFKDILELEDDSDIHKACVQCGIENLEELLELKTQEIEGLTFQADDKTTTKVGKGRRGAIICLQSLSIKRGLENDRITDDWDNITKAHYNRIQDWP